MIGPQDSSRTGSFPGRGIRPLAFVAFVLAAFLGSSDGSARAAERSEPPKGFNSQPETIPLPTPSAALQGMHLPPGFQATLFAGEPDVQQPIGITTDSRGRLWVAENYTYSEAAINFHPTFRDRVIILEDTNHDGRFDRRTVFWDQAQKLTSVAIGFGGVFALCPPRLLFVPDRNGDDVPDGEPEVLLDGWDANAVRHNIVNGLKWGPDGWLYGRHGILANSLVGPPGAARERRTTVNASIWRFHPVTHAFEVVAQGTTNPWGHDWDDHGQLFFINTVIGHLWHVVPGAFYKRMYGEHPNAHLYELIDQTADHYHWDTKEVWSDIRKAGASPSTAQAGGGHAHSGLMFYLGDNWPAAYRDALFTINFHGRRLNSDRLERRGAGYVGRHAPDFMTMDDPWFRGIDLLGGPDGGVFVSDWSDLGECHDQDGIHRSSGRIYRITYGQPAGSFPGDLAKLSGTDLVRLQLHRNDWFVRQARLILQERAARGLAMAAVHQGLRNLFETQADDTRKLRAMWCLHVTGGAAPEWLRRQLAHASEHVRAWAIQLLLDQHAPSAELCGEFARMARSDNSGLVLSGLASTLQRMPLAERWPVAEGLGGPSTLAGDPTLSLLIWYGLEPAVSSARERACALAEATGLPKLRRMLARRLTEDLEAEPSPVNRLVAMMGAPAHRADAAFQTNILIGMSEALRGWRKATPPAAWTATANLLAKSPEENVRRLVRELAVVFGDGRAADELRLILGNAGAEPGIRRRALQALVQNRAPNLVPLLQGLLKELDLAPDAVRGLASLGDPATSTILLNSYPGLRSSSAKTEVINALASRPAFAGALFEAVRSGVIRRQDVGPLQVRQMRSFQDPQMDRQLTELWPELRPRSAEKEQQLARYRKRLTPERLASANAAQGRQVFNQVCATCHLLFGEGAQIGPDLTGSDRRNLEYLLDNILDPSGVVPDSYRVSVITLKDGRVLNGVAGAKTERTLTVQTPTEKLTLERVEIESVTESQLSMMPEGLIEALKEEDLRDLIGYLMVPSQVPLRNARPVETK